MQVVLLGSAPDPRIQNDFVNLANQLHSSHADRARLCLTYDEPLSHLVCSCEIYILFYYFMYIDLLHLHCDNNRLIEFSYRYTLVLISS